MFEFLAKGGVLVIPILACSVLALAIFVERVIQYSRMGSRGAGLAERVVGLLKSGKESEARKVAEQSNSWVSD